MEPNFTVVPLYPPYGKYIMAVEQACLKLLPKVAEELKVETNQMLKCDTPIKPSISREEARAVKKLKYDKCRVILAADKRVAVVVLDKQEYINKALDLLAQRDTYRALVADPNKKYKNKLNSIHRPLRHREH